MLEYKVLVSRPRLRVVDTHTHTIMYPSTADPSSSADSINPKYPVVQEVFPGSLTKHVHCVMVEGSSESRQRSETIRPTNHLKYTCLLFQFKS